MKSKSTIGGYVLARAAQVDLGEIWDYTERTWGTEQAERYVAAIKTACEGLALRKKVGRNADRFRAGYFRYPVGSHFIFYLLPKDGAMQVMRILHQQMDLKSRLSGR